jgi:gamma-tubulin complex component 3
VAAMAAIESSPKINDLLHDIPYTLQGLSSEYVKFESDNATAKIKANLPRPSMILQRQLIESGLLYRSIQSICEKEDRQRVGLVAQSLYSAIRKELNGYLNLVSALEGEIRTQASQESEDVKSPVRVTVRKCLVWMQDAILALRLVSSILDAVKGTMRCENYLRADC